MLGLERGATLTYNEWCWYLKAREEPEYEVDEGVSVPDAGGAQPASEPPVPRWQRHVDLLTAQCCLWRRKAIV